MVKCPKPRCHEGARESVRVGNRLKMEGTCIRKGGKKGETLTMEGSVDASSTLLRSLTARHTHAKYPKTHNRRSNELA